MSTRLRLSLAVALFVLVTVALGFVAWWTFLPVAFVGAYYLAKENSVTRSAVLAALAPALAWLITALVRDLFEATRISSKLAGLLHVHYGFAVYVSLAVLILLPSAFAAYAGAATSKAFR